MTSHPFAFKDQQCNVMGLVLSWLAYFLLVYFAFERNLAGGFLILILVPCVRWALFRFFPRVSRFLGYGRVDDTFPSNVSRAPVTVTLYTFFSCPFCPIVLRRLETLQRAMDFTLDTIDITLKPQLILSKGIRSVPVVEVGSRRLVGNATTSQLAELIGPERAAA